MATIPTRSAPVAVVTGASAGVGRACARELARQGFDVALLARGAAGLAAASGEVVAEGRRALVVPTDVADAEAVEDAAERVESELGPIEAWVNVAMTTVFAPVSEVTAEELERATKVTYLGQAHGTMAALRRMRPRDRGVIVSVGSALAFRGIALQAPYCGAKFAVRGFHESLRTELRHDRSKVRVVQVHLPAVNTPQFGWCRNKLGHEAMPVPPIYEPEVAARAIVAAVLRPRRQKILGSWNWALVQVSQLAGGVVDHFAAATTVSGQQTDETFEGERAGNLFEPLDAAPGTDHGARGGFADQSGGFLDRAFLVTLPATLGNVVMAVGRRIREGARDWWPGRGRRR